jgi:hypothetical protein
MSCKYYFVIGSNTNRFMGIVEICKVTCYCKVSTFVCIVATNLKDFTTCAFNTTSWTFPSLCFKTSYVDYMLFHDPPTLWRHGGNINFHANMVTFMFLRSYFLIRKTKVLHGWTYPKAFTQPSSFKQLQCKDNCSQNVLGHCLLPTIRS